MSESPRGLSLGDFEPWVGQGCEVAVADLSLPMTLVGAREIAHSPRPDGGFELEFLGPADPVLAQNMVRISGPGGPYELFLIPCARDGAGTRYAATFF